MFPTTRTILVTAGLLLACLPSGLLAGASETSTPAADAKAVILGFDGASHDLATKFIADGLMPNCAKLAEEGTFAPFGSANPAESPVAWASLNTGENPGKTNIFGFMRRTLGGPFPTPTIGYNRDLDVPLAGGSSSGGGGNGGGAGASEAGDGGGEGGGGILRMVLLGGGALIVLIVLLKVMGKKGGAAALLLVIGGGAFLALDGDARATMKAWVTGDYTMPTHQNDLSVPNFWDHLDQAGKRSVVLQAACNYPATGGPNTKLLAGLSVPDVGGNPGTWYIYTNSDWEFDRSTQNGGRLIKFRIRDQETGKFETRLVGPKQFVEKQRREAEIDDLKAQAEAETDPKAKKKLDQQVRAAKFKFNDWKEKEERAQLKVTGTADVKAGTILFEVQDHKVTVKEGEWSDYLPVTFEVTGAFPVHAAVRFHVSECNPDAEAVRFYVPAVTVAADNQPPNMQITSPASFGKELVDKAGYFDTIGWSCQTNAFKDEEISAASFMSEIWETIQWRRRMLTAQLDAASEWDVLFQVFGTTDRVGHMTYRWYDEEHPLYDAEEANREVDFGGRMVKLKDAIPEIYKEMDNTVGIAMERMNSGDLGDDVTLMIVADHGFSSFREEVELNAFLIEAGFLAVRNDPKTGEPSKSSKMLALGDAYPDWEKTKAYSLGIGTIYLNLKGREPNGIVDPADYDKVCDEILEAMKNYKNPNSGSSNDPQVFRGGWRRSEFLAGSHAEDQRGTDRNGNEVYTEGPADIQVGFNYGYRVAWGTALGSRETKEGVVFPNKSRWSGDHTSVHPYLVRGVFFSNKTMGEHDPHLQDIAPTVLALQGVAVPEDMDGWVIPLAGLEEAAAAHEGNDVNRASVKPPAW